MMGPLQPQTNYQLAFQRALERARAQSPASLEALGAEKAPNGTYRLRVLEATFVVDLAGGTITRATTEQEHWDCTKRSESPSGDGTVPIFHEQEHWDCTKRSESPSGDGTVPIFQAASRDAAVSLRWQILTLHYLCASTPWTDSSRWVSFAHFPDARGYDPVYRGRVLGRLCATAGRDRDTFVEACQRLGAESIDSGDEGFRFQVFPRLPVVITWYYGDDEFPPNASFLYLDNILSFLPVEDVIVLSEALISRLQNRGW